MKTIREQIKNWKSVKAPQIAVLLNQCQRSSDYRGSTKVDMLAAAGVDLEDIDHRGAYGFQTWCPGHGEMKEGEFTIGTLVTMKPVWDNQTPSGQNKLGPSEKRAQIRGKTYKGIADAMAQQWG